MKRLPNKLWKLLEIALEDIQKARKNKLLILNMSHFYNTGIDEKGKFCLVCLAGCVIHYTLNKRSMHDVSDRSLDKIYAIDNLRCLNYELAYYGIYKKDMPLLLRFDLKEYIDNALPKGFPHEWGFGEIRKFKNFKKSISFYKKLSKKLKEMNL